MDILVAVERIRAGLGRPHEAELSDDDILMELWHVITLYRAALNLTHESWQIKRYPFTVDPGTPTEKNLNLSDFGQSIFIQSKDDTNPYFIQRTINVVSPEQMSMHYSGPVNLQIGGTWYTPHVAIAFSIFNENGIWKIKWLPPHLASADYTLWYVPGATVAPPIFGDQTGYPVESLNWLIISDCILNLMPQIIDEEKGPTPRQQALVEIAKKKVDQWSPVLEAVRWDGPHRENAQRRKVYGQRRSGRTSFY